MQSWMRTLCYFLKEGQMWQELWLIMYQTMQPWMQLSRRAGEIRNRVPQEGEWGTHTVWDEGGWGKVETTCLVVFWGVNVGKGEMHLQPHICFWNKGSDVAQNEKSTHLLDTGPWSNSGLRGLAATARGSPCCCRPGSPLGSWPRDHTGT